MSLRMPKVSQVETGCSNTCVKIAKYLKIATFLRDEIWRCWGQGRDSVFGVRCSENALADVGEAAVAHMR